MNNSNPRTTSEGVLFTVKVDSRVEQCLISEEALRSLSLSKNIDSTDVSPIEVFQAFEGYIRLAAQSLLKTSATKGCILLTKENVTGLHNSASTRATT